MNPNNSNLKFPDLAKASQSMASAQTYDQIASLLPRSSNTTLAHHLSSNTSSIPSRSLIPIDPSVSSSNCFQSFASHMPIAPKGSESVPFSTIQELQQSNQQLTSAVVARQKLQAKLINHSTSYLEKYQSQLKPERFLDHVQNRQNGYFLTDTKVFKKDVLEALKHELMAFVDQMEVPAQSLASGRQQVEAYDLHTISVGGTASSSSTGNVRESPENNHTAAVNPQQQQQHHRDLILLETLIRRVLISEDRFPKHSFVRASLQRTLPGIAREDWQNPFPHRIGLPSDGDDGPDSDSSLLVILIPLQHRVSLRFGPTKKEITVGFGGMSVMAGSCYRAMGNPFGVVPTLQETDNDWRLQLVLGTTLEQVCEAKEHAQWSFPDRRGRALGASIAKDGDITPDTHGKKRRPKHEHDSSKKSKKKKSSASTVSSDNQRIFEEIHDVAEQGMTGLEALLVTAEALLLPRK